MQRLQATWDRIFYLPPFEDKAREKIARGVLQLFYAWFVMGTIVISYYLLNGIWLHGILLTCTMLTTMFATKYVRQDQFEYAFVLSTSIGIAGLIVSVSFASGLYATEILVLFPILVVLTYFAPPKLMYTLLSLLVVWVWGLYFAEAYTNFEMSPSRVGPFGQALFLSLIIVFSVMMLQFTIQRMKAVNENLTLAKQAAEEANLAKSSFLATMSHELRTPLNAVIGYSDAIIEEVQESNKFSPEHLTDLESIKKSGLNLLNLINDILDISKIDANQMTCSLTTFSANELVDGVVNVVTPMAKQNQNKIVIQNRLTTKAEDLICTDEIKLNQILLNIVSNAVKYTQNGAIYINLERDGDSAIFKVVDSGIGIAESHLAIIFNPFEQIENSYSRRFSGSGLGLTISKRLIDLLSGEIEVESQLGHGSTFSIRIPVGVRDSKKITTEIDF